MGSAPAITVVIPTYNRVGRWPSVLRGLQSQTLDNDEFEVVVVSDGSTDGTNEYLSSVSAPYHFVVEVQPNGGPAVARNRGVELAQAPIIVFLDDDIVAAPSLLDHHLRRHREGHGDTAVIGPMLSPPDAELSAPIRWEQAMLYKQYDAMARGDWEPTYRQFFTGNASVPRTCVLDVGGFDRRFRRNEDVELAYRMHQAGMEFQFDADAIAFHYADRPYRSWLLNAHDYGVNDVMFARDHEEAGLIERTRHEYWRRHWLVRWATRACVAQPTVERAAQRVLHGVATATESMKARSLNQAALSGLYNVAYYCGMAQALGGPSAFYQSIARVPDENLPA